LVDQHGFTDLRPDLLEVSFRTSMIKSTLKPIMGAVLALVLYLLLTWEAIGGFEITNAGGYLLAALLAGFSERFFLRLISPALEESPAGPRSVDGM
jgi:hypothetical protein